MRTVIQRVSHASVTIDGVCKSAIKEGFMILVGIENADTHYMHLTRKVIVHRISMLQNQTSQSLYTIISAKL